MKSSDSHLNSEYKLPYGCPMKNSIVGRAVTCIRVATSRCLDKQNTCRLLTDLTDRLQICF